MSPAHPQELAPLWRRLEEQIPPQQLRGEFALRDADHFGCVLALINSRCVAEMMPDVR